MQLLELKDKMHQMKKILAELRSEKKISQENIIGKNIGA